MTTPTEARQLIEGARGYFAICLGYAVGDDEALQLIDRLADALEAFLPTDETETVEWAYQGQATGVIFGPYTNRPHEEHGFDVVSRRCTPWSPVTREAQEPTTLVAPSVTPGGEEQGGES